MVEISFIWYVRQESKRKKERKRERNDKHSSLTINPHERIGLMVKMSFDRPRVFGKLLLLFIMSNTFLIAQIVDKLIHIIKQISRIYTKYVSARFKAQM